MSEEALKTASDAPFSSLPEAQVKWNRLFLLYSQLIYLSDPYHSLLIHRQSLKCRTIKDYFFMCYIKVHLLHIPVFPDLVATM